VVEMVSLTALKAEFKSYGVRGILLLTAVAIAAAGVLCVSISEVVRGGAERAGICIGLAFIIGLTSARYPLSFPGTPISISVSEPLLFLAVMSLGPYHAALLAVVEALVAGARAKITKIGAHVFNVSNFVLSLFLSGKLYNSATSYFASRGNLGGASRNLLAFALPLLTLSIVHYVLQALIFFMVSVARGVRNVRSIWDTLPWEPVTYLACATTAGLVNYSYVHKGPLATAAVLLLVLPVPIIIYYTFKTYKEKLGEQEHHYQELTGIYDSILEMLAMAIDAKDDVTHDHIQRVKLFARRMGEAVGLSGLEIEALNAGALLHDIGKIGVPAYILNKPGKLTEHEFEQMKMHTVIGADMLSNVAFRYPVVPIVRHHHERWDGRGYPDGLRGEEIPITARILTLVDNYDALRSDRPYKTGMTREQALLYIRDNAGTFFDPTLVDLFLSMADKLEEEAASFKPPPNSKRQVGNTTIAKSSPAAGFEIAPSVDRAAKALSSIAETNQRVTALYEMARTLASHLSLEDTVAILANRLSKLIPFTTCAISLFDPTRSEFEVVHATGLHAERLLRRRMPAEAGITGWVITNQRPMFNTNPVLDLGFLGPDAASNYKGVMVFPLVKNGEALGAIGVYSVEIAAYGSEHIQLMESALQPASDAIHNALVFEQARRAAFTDQATGLPSTRALKAQFDREINRAQRLGEPLSLVVVSLDNIEEAAAAQGTGLDQVLSQVGKLLRDHVRESDILARHSVNTFVALLPDTGESVAFDVRQRIRDAVADWQYAGPISVAIGSATGPGDGSSFEALFAAAQIDLTNNRDSLDIVATTLTSIALSRTN
jgi:diguanylate cyclase (GGDEF)-like protein/putative nucleotidyltransferase with HDIG domain